MAHAYVDAVAGTSAQHQMPTVREITSGLPTIWKLNDVELFI
jgi:hypothetical protein